MFCSVCGTENRQNARFCEKCGNGLPVAAAPNQPTGGGGFAPPAVQAMASPSGQRYAEGKNSVLAIVLSAFLPAVGQIYNGDIKKCFAMWAAYFACTVLAVFTGGVAGVLNVVVWLWSIIDAYNVASRKSPLW